MVTMVGSVSEGREYKAGDVLVGKYRLKRLLGEGGMGGVWLAENIDLHAEVALKLLNRGMGDETLHKRLMGEARTMANLNHPGIVRVFDHGRTEHGEPFIAMEVLRGKTLGAMLAERERIPAVELVQTLLPVVEALHFAHGQGVIHRDLKPDNVFVVEVEGAPYPKLLDFGIAKRRTELDDYRLTRVDTVVGSPFYMSPEQAKGESDLDGRSDVFVLCVMMYECLTGEVPFNGDDYNSIMWAVVDAKPVPIAEKGVDEPLLWSIMQRGLAKKRENRWSSAREIGEALALWLREQGVEEDIAARALRSSWLPPGKRTAQLPLASFAEERRKSGARRMLKGLDTEEAAEVLPLLSPRERARAWVQEVLDDPKRRAIAAAVAVAIVGAIVLATSLGSSDAADPAPTVATPPDDGSPPNAPVGDEARKDLPEEQPAPSETVEQEPVEVLNADDDERPEDERPSEGDDDSESEPNSKGEKKSRKRRAPRRVDPFDFGF